MHLKSAPFSVSFYALILNGWNLDIKNPFVKEEEVTHTTAELLDKLSVSFKKSDELIAELRNGLAGK
ncbi:hypothetical protein [Treponema sp.]|uniref:hypothetical protein n=1 Tax=Treponema sp. TaxID=166 RepID=UPI00257B0027|nr:hypothetical protein [Treponema sp.]